jgi:hypothetical protein
MAHRATATRRTPTPPSGLVARGPAPPSLGRLWRQVDAVDDQLQARQRAVRRRARQAVGQARDRAGRRQLPRRGRQGPENGVHARVGAQDRGRGRSAAERQLRAAFVGERCGEDCTQTVKQRQPGTRLAGQQRQTQKCKYPWLSSQAREQLRSPPSLPRPPPALHGARRPPPLRPTCLRMLQRCACAPASPDGTRGVAAARVSDGTPNSEARKSASAAKHRSSAVPPPVPGRGSRMPGSWFWRACARAGRRAQPGVAFQASRPLERGLGPAHANSRRAAGRAAGVNPRRACGPAHRVHAQPRGRRGRRFDQKVDRAPLCARHHLAARQAVAAQHHLEGHALVRQRPGAIEGK